MRATLPLQYNGNVGHAPFAERRKVALAAAIRSDQPQRITRLSQGPTPNVGNLYVIVRGGPTAIGDLERVANDRSPKHSAGQCEQC
jgi:hypothetical protein